MGKLQKKQNKQKLLIELPFAVIIPLLQAWLSPLLCSGVTFKIKCAAFHFFE